MGSIQFAFAGLAPTPEPPQPPGPGPGPAPGPEPTPPGPDPGPDPAPSLPPGPGPGAGPGPAPPPGPGPAPQPDPGLELAVVNELNQPVIPPWSSGPALAYEEPDPDGSGTIDLLDNLQFSDLALNLLPGGDSGGADAPLIIGVDNLSTDPSLALLGAAEDRRVQDLNALLPDVERPACAPQQLSTQELRARLEAARQAIRGRAAGRFKTYQPAILSLAFTEDRATSADAAAGRRAFLDLTLITPSGESVPRRVQLSLDRFRTLLRDFYQQIARRDAIDPADPEAPVRQLHAALIAPIEAELREQGVTSILIATDRGLQAVPFAALHDGSQAFGERYALTLTPSLRFTCLNPPKAELSRLLAAGASSFQGLAPLPLVPQEIDGLVAQRSADAFLNQRFTPRVLLEQAADARYDRVHVATHAEFLPGGPQQARVYTGAGPVSLAEFARMRDQREGDPLELFSLSACRTAVGDSDTELGFAGLALQAGSRSAIGTLWYVDDVATSAVFLQLYRYLDQGYPKADALQATRLDLIRGRIRLEGNRVVAADGTPLLVNLTTAEQQRIRSGLSHPFFWAGITLLGTPW
ncbi:hypothetical protein SYNGFB01_04695 [Synechococcus sp. GFB01]|nr:hypothetical protein SYNGFB01_04695 [Synechococcus sp. GFB01]